MRVVSSSNRKALMTAVLLLACSGSAAGQSGDAGEQVEKTVGWFNSTELSIALTEGNSETDSVGFKNRLERRWERGRLEFRLDALRTSDSDDPYLLVEPGLRFSPDARPSGASTQLVWPPKEPDVEKYFLESRYTKMLGGSRTWNTGLSWDRNEDAGILNRYIGFGGIGNRWAPTEKLVIEAGYGLSYTDREEEKPDPEKEEAFLGFRLTTDLEYQVFESTALEFIMTGNLNLEDTSDYSLDSTTSAGVSMTDHLQLKVSLQFLFNSEPALQDVDIIARAVLVDPDPNVPGDEFYETVDSGGTWIELGEDQARKKELDTVFRASLMISF